MTATLHDQNDMEQSAEDALAADCAAIGIKMTSPWNFVGSTNNKPLTPEVVAIFLKHLELSKSPRFLEGILFAIGRPEHRRQVFGPILRTLRTNRSEQVKNAAANAFHRIVRRSDLPIIEEAVQDRSVGGERFFLIKDYARFAKRKGVNVLRTLLDQDIETRAQAANELSKLGDETARQVLEEMSRHENSHYRKIGRAGLKRLDMKRAK